MLRSCLLAALALAAVARGGSQDQNPTPRIELKDGDRIVFLGDGFFEGEYEHGYIETAIASRFPDIKLTFRNLGWTGDTVWGDARAGFDTAKEGFQRRAALVKELKPNVILVCYGMNESFAGEEGLPKFEEGLKALLDSLEETKAKVVLISPIVHENLGPPLPDREGHNRELLKYRDVMKRVAMERGSFFVDMMAHRIGDGTRPERVVAARETTDGIHLNAFGYAQAAVAIAEALRGLGFPSWEVHLKADGRALEILVPISGTRLSDVECVEEGLRFQTLDDQLPVSPDPPETPGRLRETFRAASFHGLSAGVFALRADTQEIARRGADAWAKRVVIDRSPELDQVERLRRAIVEKNKLLFHRLRPQNETYLYLFRKHEQGHMAGEVPQFDPLIAEKEAEIDRLKKPVPHTYELIRVEEGK